MKKPTSAILLVVAALFLSSCHSRVLYEKTLSLPPEGWNQNNFLAYTIPVDNTTNMYQISLIIRNDARYEYSNLFLFINTTAPGGQGIRDTVEVRLSDERGSWLGRGIGGKHTLQIPFKTQVQFPEAGNYTIEIEHGMRAVDLKFITDVGIRIKNLN